MVHIMLLSVLHLVVSLSLSVLTLLNKDLCGTHIFDLYISHASYYAGPGSDLCFCLCSNS